MARVVGLVCNWDAANEGAADALLPLLDVLGVADADEEKTVGWYFRR